MSYLYDPSPEDCRAIHTKPGRSSDGQPFDRFVRAKLGSGAWRLECIRPDVLGLSRPLEVFRAERRSNLVKPWPRSDDAEAYCPAHWADLAIGCGACGFRCRACFLILTHRVKCDPSRHVLYENVDAYEQAVRKWLRAPTRRNLGLGIDCSDSLLYEGVTGHARRLAPLFTSPETNPYGCKLILLTKSVNVDYLRGLATENILVTFSLNPEPIADLWEGKFADGQRVTPPVGERLRAALTAQAIGFEVRWRVDPIFPVDGWRDIYTEFFTSAASAGHRPTRLTLGTYRETRRALGTFARRWGLPAIEWDSFGLQRDGAHYHLPRDRRIEIYRYLADAVAQAWGPGDGAPGVALCKEPRTIRREVGLDHDRCNCG